MDSVFNLFATLSLKADEFNKGLDNAKQKMDGFGSQMKTATDGIKGKIEAVAPKFQEVGQKFQEVGTKVTSVGKTIAPVSAAFTAVGIAGVKSFAEVDKTMALTNQTMGNTPQQAKLLGDAMKEAAANSTFGMNDAAQASLNFARAGLDAQQAADTLAPAMNLAAGEGGNLDTVSQGLVATINGFGDEFGNAGQYADVFANACNNSALDVDSLSNAMSVAAPIFSAAGYSVNDAALYMGTMANAGIDANVAANSLKTGMARLIEPSKQGAEWMKKLGIEVTNSDGTMKDSVQVQKELHDAFAGLSDSEQVAAASAIFGKNQMSNWLALINTAPGDVESLSSSLEKEGTTAEMAEAMMGGFGGSLEKLKSSADVASTSLGEALAPTIERIADVIQKAVDWFNNLDDSQKETIAQVVLLVAGLAPLLIIGGKVIGGIGTIITTIPMLIAGITTVGGAVVTFATVTLPGLVAAIAPLAVAAAPFLIGGAIVAGIIAGIVLIVKNWDKIKETAGKVKEAVVEKWNALKEKTGEIFGNIATAVKEKFEAVKQAVVEKAGQIKEKVSEKFGNLKETVGEKFAGVKQTVTEKMNGVKEAAGNAVENMLSNTKSKLNSIKQAYDSHGGGVKGAVAAYMEAVKQKYETVYNAINTLTNGKLETVVNTVRTKMQSVVTNAQQKLNELKGKFTGLVTDALTWGRDLGANFAKGIKEKINAVKKTVSDLANKVKKLIHFSKPDEGPLADFDTYAPDMMELFAKGIKDNARMVQDTVADAFDFSQPTIPETGAQLAFAGAGGQYTGNGQNIDTGAFSEAVVNALDDLTVIVNIGQERLEGVVNQVIQKRNYKSGGR